MECIVPRTCLYHCAITTNLTVNPVHVSKCQCSCYFPCSVLHNHPGDCHLAEWSEWSTCELTCINGRSFETMGRQSRSRTFIVQSFENQDSCPQQVLETRPCTGTKSTFQFSALIEQHLFYLYVRCNRTAVIIFTCRRQMLSLHMESKSLEQ